MTQEQQVAIFMKQLENPWFAFGFSILVVLVLAWKGFALWKASQNKSLPWFIAILILNTFGILEMTYIFYFSKKSKISKED